MFIRVVKKKNGPKGKTFPQYTLAQTSRINGVVKQRAILYLGTCPLLEDPGHRVLLVNILKSKIFNQPALFKSEAPKDILILAESYYQKYLEKFGEEPSLDKVSIPPSPEKADMHSVDISKLKVIEVKTVGAENLCKQTIDKLQLTECLTSLNFKEDECTKALIAICARAIFCASEYKTAQYLEDNSELNACFNYTHALSHKQLYHAADQLYGHKAIIDQFLYQRIGTLFNLEDRLVIFDISNTYFEGKKVGSSLAQFGRNKEKRYDCKQVVFSGVINQEGFIRHSRIYEGNKPDVHTLEDMITDLERYSSKECSKTIVMDAGISSEENLKMIVAKGYDYVCVARKKLERYTLDQTAKVFQLTDRDENIITLTILKPNEFNDTWMYVQSPAKARKERSIDVKLAKRFEEELEGIKNALSKKGSIKKTAKVCERIGRVKQKHHHISPRYDIQITEEGPLVTDLTWSKKTSQKLADQNQGVYFIRTSINDINEKKLWSIYNCIREVESTFRCLKSDLNIRPVFHQNDIRVEAHLYLTLLAYQLVNTIRFMLKQKEIHIDWNNIVRIMNTQLAQTIVLNTDKKQIHIKKSSEPIDKVKEIYSACNCEPKLKSLKKYVVYH